MKKGDGSLQCRFPDNVCIVSLMLHARLEAQGGTQPIFTNITCAASLASIPTVDIDELEVDVNLYKLACGWT